MGKGKSELLGMSHYSYVCRVYVSGGLSIQSPPCLLFGATCELPRIFDLNVSISAQRWLFPVADTINLAQGGFAILRTTVHG